MKSPAYTRPACVSPQAEEHPNGCVPEARSVQLTARQREVLMLLCEGLPNKLIGRRLNISGATVKVHIGHILRELGVGSRLQAVVAARRLSFRPLTGAAAQDGHGLSHPGVRASDAG